MHMIRKGSNPLLSEWRCHRAGQVHPPGVLDHCMTAGRRAIRASFIIRYLQQIRFSAQGCRSRTRTRRSGVRASKCPLTSVLWCLNSKFQRTYRSVFKEIAEHPGSGPGGRWEASKSPSQASAIKAAPAVGGNSEKDCPSSPKAAGVGNLNLFETGSLELDVWSRRARLGLRTAAKIDRPGSLVSRPSAIPIAVNSESGCLHRARIRKRGSRAVFRLRLSLSETGGRPSDFQ